MAEAKSGNFSSISVGEADGNAKKSVNNSVPSVALPVNACAWNLFLCVMAIMYGSYGVLVHSCEVNGELPFSTAAVAFLIEFFKLSITVVLHFVATYRAVQKEKSCSVEALQSSLLALKRASVQLTRFRTSFPFLLLAALYTVNNNLAQYLQLQMDPATYQVLSNLKIVTTTVLYRVIIRRPISGTHYCALAVLTVASVLNTVGGFTTAAPAAVHGSVNVNVNTSVGKRLAEDNVLRIHITLLGVVMIAVYSTVSGLSGVCSEYVLKRNAQLSLHLQNAYLYGYGVVLNGLLLYTQRQWTVTDAGQWSYAVWLLRGFSPATWVLVLTQSCVGLMMSAVMKFSSNITRLFVIGSAMICSTVLSVLCFSLQLNLCFFTALLLATVALFLYQTDGRCR